MHWFCKKRPWLCPFVGYRSVLVLRSFSYPENVFLFAKSSILYVLPSILYLCSEYFCLDNCSVIRTVTFHAMYYIRHIRNSGIHRQQYFIWIYDSRFSEALLFGNSSFNNTKKILNTTIEYIVSSKRFEVPLFDCFRYLCMAVLFTPYYFHFLILSIFYFFKIFLFFIGLFPIIIDLVFNLFIM